MKQDYIAVPISLIENMCKALSEYELTDKDCFDEIHDACVDIDAFCRDKLHEGGLEQEPCDDCISRKETLDICLANDGHGYIWRQIKSLPPVTPAEKVGHWIDGKCNRCGTHAPYWAMASTYYCSDYCPKCGSKMQEVEE